MKKFLLPMAFAAICASLNAQETVACLGKITASETIARFAAPSPMGSTPIVEQIFVKKGDEVAKGQKIAILKGSAKAEAALEKSKANLTALKSSCEISIEEIKNQIEELAGTYEQNIDVLKKDPPRVEREKINYEQKSILRKLNQSKNMLELVKADAKNKIALAEISVKEAQAVLDEFILASPISGKIVEINSKLGEVVSEGGICEISDTSSMFVEAEVYVSDISKVKTGDECECVPEALGNEVLKGRVFEISPYVKSNRLFSQDPAEFTDRKVIFVKIKLDNPEKVKNLIGSLVRVKISAK
ncbi:efflux RND transporter periplasmic adaptor subunit [Intestinicryptomonas porci]|uniref:Efflux RND transporter periplasmic adaptor subunit n=1 Tax=Intestinicryptomonas porci TaxID=2926320 RepID=A0ABU4WJF3_9BACT|nr:efflux RND transporter periplasmic adaptor subunit [Opitutales bacterium CLA-KB-P66]